MTWDVNKRGFLPPNDPLQTLLSSRWAYTPLTGVLENVSVMLPFLVEERRFREEVVAQLRPVSHHFDDNFLDTAPPEYLERLMLLYSYLASAYVYARHEIPATRIPQEIAVPLVKIAKKVGRHPILSYASYCLTNWRRLNPMGQVELGNIELLQNFCSPAVGKQDEDWFILVHVEIEARAAQGVAAIDELLVRDSWLSRLSQNMTSEEDELFLAGILRRLSTSMVLMNAVLSRMPERCSPDNYFRWVRPYIFSFKDVVYEGCFDNKPVTFRGETGAQSSIVPSFLPALGIKHQDSLLTKHLTEMREYMPEFHRRYIARQEGTFRKYSLREAALKYPSLRHEYNECVQQLLDFRSMHFEYAVNYIAKKVENPEGTGGTPYIPWLQQLRDETERHLISG